MAASPGPIQTMNVGADKSQFKKVVQAPHTRAAHLKPSGNAAADLAALTQLVPGVHQVQHTAVDMAVVALHTVEHIIHVPVHAAHQVASGVGNLIKKVPKLLHLDAFAPGGPIDFFALVSATADDQKKADLKAKGKRKKRRDPKAPPISMCEQMCGQKPEHLLPDSDDEDGEASIKVENPMNKEDDDDRDATPRRKRMKDGVVVNAPGQFDYTKVPRGSIFFVVTGPSGAGKTTIIRKILQNQSDKFAFCCSHTTRVKREDEDHGHDYHFVKDELFLEMLENKEFIECMQLNGCWYGTSYMSVTEATKDGKVCIMDLSINGLKSLREHYTGTPKPVCMFVCPPSLEVCEQRLVARGTETDEVVEFRMQQAARQMDYFASMDGQGLFDFHVTNDKMDETMSDFAEGLSHPDADRIRKESENTPEPEPEEEALDFCN